MEGGGAGIPMWLPLARALINDTADVQRSPSMMHSRIGSLCTGDATYRIMKISYNPVYSTPCISVYSIFLLFYESADLAIT